MKGERNQVVTAERRQKQCIFAIAAAGVVLGCAVIGADVAGIRINTTPSAALGLWRIIPIDRTPGTGDLVFVCPPLTAEVREGLRRGYLRRGLCPGALAPLIKRIAAVAGQNVVIADDGVYVDGRILLHSQVLQVDAAGRRLAAHAGGEILPGMVYLHSDYRYSFDSRYFGPVPVESLMGFAHKVSPDDL